MMRILVNGIQSGLRFSSAHVIPGHESCGYIHGHSYFVDVEIEGERAGDFEFVVDFKDVKGFTKAICDELDHRLLIPVYNNLIEFKDFDKDNDSMIQAYNMSGDIDDKTLRNIVFAYGGEDNLFGGEGVVLLLSKKDLIAFGDVRSSTTKQAVYEITPDGRNPNTGIIKDGGLSVRYCINANCTAYCEAEGTEAGVSTMIVGDPMNYKLGLFGDYEITVSEDYKFGEGLLAVRGEVLVAGNVIKDKGFVVVKKVPANP